MRKTILFLALGMFLSASVTANACDGGKVCSKSSKAHASHVKASKSLASGANQCTKDPNCISKGCTSTAVCPTKNCPSSSSCTKSSKASKTSKASLSTAEKS